MVYAIDVWWNMNKTFRVEAKSREEAEAIVDKEMEKLICQPNGAVNPLDEGFECGDDYESKVSGEGETADEIRYY